MADILKELQDSTDYIRKLYAKKPEVGIVLGSGLGNFSAEMKIDVEIDYNDIPHFPVSTVEGHHGKLIFGELGGKIGVPYIEYQKMRYAVSSHVAFLKQMGRA